ncbi:MAG: hypothetical protein Q7T30_03260 [Planctomycetota bacterium]|nr:hypothetical protein [Planctomycetota bacterium]
MKNMLVAVALLSVSFLAGCANSVPAKPMMNTACPVSGEPASADHTVDYRGMKLGFCCDKCITKWNGMDEASQKTAFDASMTKK